MPEETPKLLGKDFAKVFTEWPLYGSAEVADKDVLWSFLYSPLTIDIYCPLCHDRTLMVGGNVTPYDFPNNFKMEIRSQYTKVFKCQRDERHLFRFNFITNLTKITKIGQHPAIADLEAASISKYSKSIDPKDFEELKRAVGLSSHGIGIGSFVYLRRIFERLVETCHSQAVNDPEWDEEKYVRSRMDEKIKLLKDHVPPFLFENGQYYSVVSAGIHALDESECRTLFPMVLAGIESILDSRLEDLNKKKKMSDAAKGIEAAKLLIAGKLSGKTQDQN